MTGPVLWTASEIAAITKGNFSGKEITVSGISIDTRKINPGDLFIALSGPNFDGNDFAEQALEKGATAVLTTKSGNENFITVPDTFAALHELGAGARARSSAKIIAVTGSVGKTSVKSMLNIAFSALGKTHASDASLNNHWGVPLSLARMPKDAEYAIFEIGMNHANEITPLSKLVSPHVAIITTIASAHIQYLGSIENIALAKSEIFHGMQADGVAILPRDSEQFPILLAEARTQGLQKIISFGQHADSDIQLVSVNGDQLEIHQGQKDFTLHFGMSGLHQAVNALSVIAAIDALGKQSQKAFDAFSDMTPVAGRGDTQEVTIAKGQPAIVVIDETHNASPIAVKAALRVLEQSPTKGRRVVILGDMLELGPNSPEFHAELSDAVVQSKADLVLLSGPMMSHLAKKLGPDQTHYYPDSAALVAEVATLIQPGDMIVVKGSRGSKMKLVVDALVDLGQFK